MSPLQLKSTAAGLVRGLIARTGLANQLARHTQGKSPRSFLARLAPPHTAYPSPSLRTVVRDGLEFELDVSDFMQWCVFFGIALEPRAALYSLAQPGAHVLDVGTNVGETMLHFARAVGPSGFVHGFEINPTTFDRCQRNLARNHITNARLHQIGLGDAEGTLTLERPTLRNTGGDRLRTGSAAAGAGAVEVRVTTLDSFVASAGLQRLDLIKIDVEGFETRIIRGGRLALARLRPKLFMEMSDQLLRGYGSSARELVDELNALGYDLTHAETKAAVGPSYDFEGSHFDVIGVPRSTR